MASPKASGKPEQLIAKILRLDPQSFTSRRGWGRAVRDLVCCIANSGLDAAKMARIRGVPAWLSLAAARQRRINYFISTGMSPKEAAAAANA